MRCGTECALITRCMALRGLQMVSVGDGSVTMNTKPWVTHCVRRHAERFWPAAIAAARFLALTGWRSGEALGLRWHEIDLVAGRQRSADTKTGRSVRPLSNAACDVLRSLSRSGDLVFPATRGNGDVFMSGFKKLWKRIVNSAALPPDVTPHVLRHSFAKSRRGPRLQRAYRGAGRHQGRSITSRYLHSADAVLLAAADAVANADRAVDG